MIALVATLALAQEPADSRFELEKTRHLRTQRVGMGVLMGWSGVNLAGGGLAFAVADTPRREGFWGGNAAWNVVNLGIATASLASIGARQTQITDYTSLERSRDNFERALLLNIGLDVAYVMAGLALRERALRADDLRLRGFSDALVLQGGFLFVFDIGLFAGSRYSRRSKMTP